MHPQNLEKKPIYLFSESRNRASKIRYEQTAKVWRRWVNQIEFLGVNGSNFMFISYQKPEISNHRCGLCITYDFNETVTRDFNFVG